MRGYVPITAETAREIQTFTEGLGGIVPCDSSAGTLLTWCAPQGGLVRLEDGWMSAYWPKYGLLGFPLLAGGGRPTAEAMRAEVEALAAQAGAQGRVMDVRHVIDVPADWTEANAAALAEWCDVARSDGWRDYIYAADDLADLPGAKYSAKRNLIHQFERQRPGWRVEPLREDPHECAGLRGLIDEWRSGADGSAGALAGDLAALEAAFGQWGAGVFEGLALRADDPARGRDALLGFCVFSAPTREMADVHFEKAARDAKGAAQMINREAARLLRARGARWINREQDMNVPGLRRAKADYHPAMLTDTRALEIKG